MLSARSWRGRRTAPFDGFDGFDKLTAGKLRAEAARDSFSSRSAC
jgi:hypothetical protein